MADQANLAALLNGLGGEPFGDWDRVRVGGLAIDSRAVGPGGLFIALSGLRTDGSRFVDQAVERGAVALVLGQDVPVPPSLAGVRTANPRELLPVVAARFYRDPSRSLRVVGITGTNGKTTTAYMVSQMLNAAGRVAAYWTTNEVNSLRRRFRPLLTTPEAIELQAFLREVVDAGGTDACIEVSSHAVVMHRADAVSFAAGAVTNVTPDHLDFHGGFEAYLQAKRGFVRFLTPPAVCCFGADDAGARAAVQGAGVEALACGLSPDADLRACDVALSATGARCRLVAGPRARAREVFAGLGPDGLAVALPVPGRHNLQNAVLAAGVALVLGTPAESVGSALASFQPAARRLHAQRIGPFTVIDDVAMNEASYDAVFAAVEGFHDQVVVASALRGNRGPEVNAAIAQVLARWNRRLRFAPVAVSISTSAVARYGADYRVRPEEVDAFTEAARAQGLACDLFEELDDALAAAAGRLRPGGVLLLLGTFGMDEGPSIAARLLAPRA